MTKLYPPQRPWELEPYYCRHVEAMTAEGLHEKSDIAAQLAWRDKRIAELESTRASASKSVEALASRLLDLLPGADMDRACELIRADRRAVIVSVCKWLESRGAHPRDGRMFAAEDVLHNITDPGEPFEDLGFGSLVQEQSDD